MEPYVSLKDYLRAMEEVRKEAQATKSSLGDVAGLASSNRSSIEINASRIHELDQAVFRGSQSLIVRSEVFDTKIKAILDKLQEMQISFQASIARVESIRLEDAKEIRLAVIEKERHIAEKQIESDTQKSLKRYAIYTALVGAGGALMFALEKLFDLI